jgi:hypothetical protein
VSRDTQFKPGQSGNPKGRPRKRTPNVSAFDIVFDRTLTITQNGVERELTVDEALELQTYQAALKGSRMAIRQVLKMIERREGALAERRKPAAKVSSVQVEYDANNADEAMRILGIAAIDLSCDQGGYWGHHLKLTTWATQAALGGTGRRRIDRKEVEDIERLTINPDALRWPRGTEHD